MNVKCAILVLSLLVIDTTPKSSVASLREYTNRFKVAQSEREKLILCIDAIDAGAIERFGPVKNVDEIFGTTFSQSLPPKGDPRKSGVVHFGEELKAPDGNQGAWLGWGLYVEYSSNGAITDYNLSNIDK